MGDAKTIAPSIHIHFIINTLILLPLALQTHGMWKGIRIFANQNRFLSHMTKAIEGVFDKHITTCAIKNGQFQ